MRHVFDVRADAVRSYEFARDRATTEWQRLYQVGVTTIWVEELLSRVDHVDEDKGSS